MTGLIKLRAGKIYSFVCIISQLSSLLLLSRVNRTERAHATVAPKGKNHGRLKPEH